MQPGAKPAPACPRVQMLLAVALPSDRGNNNSNNGCLSSWLDWLHWLKLHARGGTGTDAGTGTLGRQIYRWTAAGGSRREKGMMHEACAACVFTKLNRNNARNCCSNSNNNNNPFSATTIKCKRLQKRLSPDPCPCPSPSPCPLSPSLSVSVAVAGLTNQTKAPPPISMPMPPYLPVCLTACGSTWDLGASELAANC